MDIEIKVPNLGSRVGTCGWLCKKLQSGEIKISPGHTKTRKPGLWLTTADSQSQLLALFNPYDLRDHELGGQNRFFTSDDFSSIVGGGASLPWTRAAWGYLMGIAQAWVDKSNALSDEDVPNELSQLTVTIE